MDDPSADAPETAEIRTVRHRVALGATLLSIAVVAMALHRHGHTQGDDFALYLRQAKSVFEGGTRDVVADNRFSVNNSGGAFSPEAYPWGAPLLFAPFVKLWGLDYDRLKLVEVAVFCGWLLLVHGIVRRRIGRPVAWAIVVVLGTAPVLAGHTDSLLSEYPHAFAVAVVIWWLDRIDARSWLIDATTRQLVVLGLLIAAAYNVRRESLVLIGAIAMIQAVQLAARWRERRRGNPDVTVPLWHARLPHASFIVAAGLFQLVLPSMLVPDNADSGPHNIPSRLKELPALLSNAIGLDPNHALGMVIIVIALFGVVVGIATRPRLDGTLYIVAVLSLLAVSTHFRATGPRYYFQVLPWFLYFAAVGVIGVVQLVATLVARRRITSAGAARVGAGIAVGLLLLIAVTHPRPLSTRIATVRTFNESGAQQVGPTHPEYRPIYRAVLDHTDDDAVITFYRARTMTLLTDRRAIQTGNIDRAEQRSDYFAQLRNSTYSQPGISEAEALRRGYTIVWSDDRWILWDLHPDD